MMEQKLLKPIWSPCATRIVFSHTFQEQEKTTAGVTSRICPALGLGHGSLASDQLPPPPIFRRLVLTPGMDSIPTCGGGTSTKSVATKTTIPHNHSKPNTAAAVSSPTTEAQRTIMFSSRYSQSELESRAVQLCQEMQHGFQRQLLCAAGGLPPNENSKKSKAVSSW